MNAMRSIDPVALARHEALDDLMATVDDRVVPETRDLIESALALADAWSGAMAEHRGLTSRFGRHPLDCPSCVHTADHCRTLATIRARLARLSGLAHRYRTTLLDAAARCRRAAREGAR